MTEDVDTGNCGTYAGWNRHAKARTTPCGPCREAQRRYMAEYRANNPEFVEHNRLRNAARSRALTALSNEYQARFRELYEEELSRI